MTLKSLLEEVSNALYDKSESSDKKILLFNEATPTTIMDGLSTYRNNLFYGAADALRSTFVVTDEVLTSNNFNYFSRKYLLEIKSKHHDLSMLSHGFPEFLASQKELAASPWVYDLAKFELAWENLELGFGNFVHPQINNTLATIQLNYQILDVWKIRLKFFDQGGLPSQESHWLVMWGDEHSNYCEPLHTKLGEVLHKISEAPGGDDLKILLQQKGNISEQEASEIIDFMASKNWLT